MRSVIPGYCSAAPNASVSNSVTVGAYGSSLGSASTVGCVLGYAASGSSALATCSAYNATNGQWTGLSLNCTRT